jgi:hypothetical protein
MFLFTEKYVILIIPFTLFVLTLLYLFQERYDRKKYNDYIKQQKELASKPTSAKIIKFEQKPNKRRP